MSDSMSHPGLPVPWLGRVSLRLWLTSAVVLTVFVAVGIGTFLDYRREYRAGLGGAVAALEEQAQALRIARERFNDLEEFALYVDEFCAQMNDSVSPGHNFLVLDEAGNIIVNTRHHSGPEVEQALLAATTEQHIVNMPGHRLAQFRLRDVDGTVIIAAQYLDHMENLLRTQLLSRAVTATGMSVGLVVLVFLVIHIGVLKPIARLTVTGKAWADRNFADRVRPTGPSDLRRLAGDFNFMAEQLDADEQNRLIELDQARRIQRSFLPGTMPRVSDLMFSVSYRPAVYVAGDLYDIFELPKGRIAVIVLDVAGHGISAALLTGVVKMSLRHWLTQYLDAARAMTEANRELPEGSRFVTACVGIWNTTEHSWTYASAGHPGGVVVSGGHARVLDSTGPPLGVLSGDQWQQETIGMTGGDRLFLYTDGVVDVGIPDDMMGETGLIHILESGGHETLEQQASHVMAEVESKSVNGLLDDATLVAFEVLQRQETA